MASLEEQIRARLTAHLERARDALGEAWAEAAQERSPIPRLAITYDAGCLVVPAIAWFLHHGTKPHEINARWKPYLHFLGRNGSWARVKTVHHPGTKGNGFLDDAWQSVRVQATIRDLGRLLYR